MRKILLPVLLAAFFSFMMLISSNDIKTVYYEINTSEIKGSVRLCLIADLHSSKFGENQDHLIGEITKGDPDVVLLSGDILDDEVPHEDGLIFLNRITKLYPTYYVTGNHEFWTEDIEGIKQMVEDAGGVVLAGEAVEFNTAEDVIYIGGVDDPTYILESGLMAQLESAEQTIKEDEFSVLLSHRPELTEIYTNTEFDLILAGHAHGGQWRIPGLINGVFSPDQGFFPDYAGGEYSLGDNTLIVSRGLSITSTIVPRIFNNPELVFIDIVNNAER